MKIPQILKLAVEKADWKLVCAAFTAITGEPLSPPEPPKPKTVDFLNMEVSPELLEQLGISNSQEDYSPPSSEEQTVEEAEEEPRFIASTKSSEPHFRSPNEDGKLPTRTEEIRIIPNRGNKFTDDLDFESGDLKENNPVLAETYAKVKKHMTRSMIEGADDTSVAKINVTCSLCGTRQMISPILAKGWNTKPDDNTFKCNSCCTPSGRSRAHRKNNQDNFSGRSGHKK